MNKYKISGIILFMMLLVWCVRRKIRTYYIGLSPIHGKGLFALTEFNSGDVIIGDIFPHRPSGIFFYNIPPKLFDKSISLDGKYINHCSSNDNSTIVTTDYKRYSLVATRYIPVNGEITSNYNEVNLKFPFIKKAKESFAKC